MEVEWLLVIHGLVTLLVLISFLCGQWPIFEGTFIQKIHFFLTFGACDYFRYSFIYMLMHIIRFRNFWQVFKMGFCPNFGFSAALWVLCLVKKVPMHSSVLSTIVVIVLILLSRFSIHLISTSNQLLLHHILCCTIMVKMMMSRFHNFFA